MSDNTLTREGLIWLLAKEMAKVHGPAEQLVQSNPTLLLDLVSEIAAAVDGKRHVPPTKPRPQPQGSPVQPGWMGR